MTNFRRFSYGGLHLLVSSEAAAHLDWLDEFLIPHFEVRIDGSPDCRVSLVEDDRRYKQVVQFVSGGDEIECFALDSRVVRLPSEDTPEGEAAIYDEHFDVCYLVRESPCEVVILTRSGNRRARVPLMRVIREFAMNESMSRGHIFLHASAFVIGGRGVIVAGPKRAGKTTLLIHALSRGGSYLTNDRVLVSLDSPAPVFRGMPTIITIRPPSLAFFPHLDTGLRANGYHHDLTMLESGQLSGPTRPFMNDKFCLTPTQFCSLLNAPTITEAEGFVLLCPCITDDQRGIQLRHLAEDIAAERLRRSLFGSGSLKMERQVFHVENRRLDVDDAKPARCCEILAARLQCFECLLGEGAYLEEPSVVEQLEEILLG